MNSRERLTKALEHKESDRVPIDLGGASVSLIHQTSHNELVKFLNIKNPQDKIHNLMTMCVYVDDKIKTRFGADIELIQQGKPDSWELKINQETKKWVDDWGCVYKKPEGIMYYEWDYQPLEDAETIDDINNFNWPDPKDPGRYRGIKDKVVDIYKNTGKAMLVNSAYGIWEQTFTLRSLDKALMDLAANQKFAKYLAQRLLEWLLEYYEMMLSPIGEYIQVVKMDDDLGFRNGPLMSPDIYRKIYKPVHKKIVEFIKSKTDAKIFIHSDGSIYDFIPDFIDIGIDIINPVEVTAKNMDSKRLKTEFGKDISFWGGGCDNTILEKGTPKQVTEEVKKRISDFAPDGGLVFGSIHCIQPFVPPENIVALFDSALEFGHYPVNKNY
ncbi:uroporphyrinogen decarboxylase family protein [Actinomycetota bacterium]